MKPVRFGRLAAAVIVILAVTRLAGADEKFVAGFTDLPLMPGLSQFPDATVAFDTVSGRIVMAFARTILSEPEIASFYGETLAQLGWRPQPDKTFLRENERLALEYLQDGTQIIVRFSLTPE